jgi:hypothetical protein
VNQQACDDQQRACDDEEPAHSHSCIFSSRTSTGSVLIST